MAVLRILLILMQGSYVEVEERRGDWVRLRPPEHGFTVDASDKWILTRHPEHGRLMHLVHVEQSGGVGF